MFMVGIQSGTFKKQNISKILMAELDQHQLSDGHPFAFAVVKPALSFMLILHNSVGRTESCVSISKFNIIP